MATKSYEIEVINWQWQTTKTSRRKNGDQFWFSRSGNSHPRIKRFSSMMAARNWLESNCFKPVFSSARRPCIFRSPMGGIEARIVLANDKFGFFPSGSTEARWARR